MVEFAITLMGKLELINTHSFNSFKLRIGKKQPLFSGSEQKILSLESKIAAVETMFSLYFYQFCSISVTHTPNVFISYIFI